MKTPIVPTAELAPGTTAVFQVEVDGARDGAFAVRLPSGEIRAFVNRCRHANLPLDYADGRFLDQRGLLRCQAHGAGFRPDDGLCVEGPCLGKQLRPIKVEVEGGVAYATAVAQPAGRPPEGR
jgi:nitrite reductase/ring-hydroxylating ferredoxin subunit